MINAVAVLKRVRNLSDIDDSEAFDTAPVVRAACKQIYERLKDKKSADDERIIEVCVYISYYRILLKKVLLGDVADSVKAGDLTISQSPSLKLEKAASMRDEAMLAAYPLLKDVDFVFKQV